MNFSEYFIEVIKKWLIRNYIFLKNSRLVHRQNRSMVRIRGQSDSVSGNHPLIYAPMVEMVKTPPSQGGSCGFEPHWEYHMPLFGRCIF